MHHVSRRMPIHFILYIIRPVLGILCQVLKEACLGTGDGVKMSYRKIQEKNYIIKATELLMN